MNEIVKRAKAPTPKFFRRLRTYGLITGSIVATLLAAPIALPAAAVTALTYLGTVAATAVTVSQLTVDDKQLKL